MHYKCVNCGTTSNALYKTYGPSVLKLTKCVKCKGIVDKYIEYDPVIVMIDLVLVCKEAQRHVIYNTQFKSYWKLLIILILLETYGLWKNDSLFNIAVNTTCRIQSNSTNTTNISLPINVSIPESWKGSCWGWKPMERGDDNDLFIWEKDFYIQFMSTFAGIVVFIVTVHSSMRTLKLHQNEVSLTGVLKAFSLAYSSVMFTLCMLVWGPADTPIETRTVHYLLVFGYSFVVHLNVFMVLYECTTLSTLLVLVASYCAKCLTTFHLTPYIRGTVS